VWALYASGIASGHDALRSRLLLAVLLLTFGYRFLRIVRFGFGLGDLFVPGFVQSRAKPHIDGKALACASFIYAADRRNVAVIAPVGYSDVAKFDGLA